MLISWIVVFLSCVSVSQSYKILAVLPFPSKSHYAIPDPILVRLAEKGHEVTVYNPYLKKKPIPNYKEVFVGDCFPAPTDILTLDTMKSLSANALSGLLMLFMFAPSFSEVSKCKPLAELLNSTEKYDLFITESFNTDVLLMFADKFDVPIITVNSNVLFPWLSDRMGNPSNPSYVPNIFGGTMTRMSYWERVENVFIYLVSYIGYDYYILRNDNAIAKQLLGSGTPSLYDTVRRTSVIFTNTHSSINYAVPLVPGVVEIGGIHMKPAAALPKNIEKFINESEHGVVYFCMGSLLRGETFPEEKRNAFLHAFSKIPQRVLWKWEGDVLPGQSDKIMISKWMPQRDILAHPNVKLFISHGGLLGTSEAVYEGVPVLGIPIFGDQRTNIRSLEANGAGELLDYNEISKEVVLEKVQRLLTDPKYKKNAKELSERYRDRPMSPLDTAVYWTEYVIRHKGAPHLRTAAADMPWYQYLLLDVIAFLLGVAIVILIITYYITKFILSFIYNLLCGSSKSKEKKTDARKKRN